MKLSYGQSTPETDSANYWSASQPSSTDLGLKRAEKIAQATDATLQEHDYAKAAAMWDELLSSHHDGWVLDWVTAAVANAHLDKLDRAFELLDSAISHGLELSSDSIQESLTRYGAKTHLEADPRFPKFLSRLDQLRSKLEQQMSPATQGVATPSPELLTILQSKDMEEPHKFYESLRDFNHYPTPNRTDCWLRYELELNGSVTAPYFVYVPPHYDSSKPTGLIVYLHGGVVSRPKFIEAYVRSFITDNPFLPIARHQNYLMLFPCGKQDLKWWDRSGMECIERELAETKKRFNVDDDRVWVAGHSNGATGAFALCANTPSHFAAFYPLNGPPTAHRLGNLQCRPIYSVLSTQDSTFPIDQMRTYWKTAHQEKAQWMLREMVGHDHDYHSYIQQQRSAFAEHMQSAKRPALPHQITWEALSVPSRCDWLQISSVTPGENRAEWHRDTAFTLEAKQPNGEKIVQEVRYGEKIGKVRATYVANTFHVETSQVKDIKLYLHPQMIDFRYPVRVMVNEKLAFEQMMPMSTDVMQQSFEQSSDRKRVWCNTIDVQVPST